MSYKREFIEFMVRSKVLTFGDFVTKSGRRTPYFINTGNYRTGAQAAKLGEYYAACVQEHFPDGVDALFGPAYKGIVLVGYPLKAGDRVVIIEDVITAGTAMRECLPILKGIADVEIAGLVVSADRMERGKGELSAIQEIKAEYGIDTYPIVTVREIIETLHNTPVDGQVIVDDEMREKMEAYLRQYGI